MQKHKLRIGLVRAAAVGAAALSAALIVGGGVASAAIPSDPPGGATPLPPHFYNGNVEGIRDSGSDTTFFMMQKIGDLYTGAGLYGCTLNSTNGQSLYNSSDPASNTTSNDNFFCVSGGNVSTTDVNDNWDRVEVTQGVDSVGSGAGQNQLCGAAHTPLPIDFSRSSKPAGTACTGLVGTGYAKDGVDLLGYPVNPTQVGTGVAATAPYSGINGGVVGPVDSGWLPGDPNTGPFTGRPLATTGITNVGGAASSAYELWCATDSTRITDWGQLTNLGPNIVVPNASVTSGSNQVTLAAAPYSAIATGQTITGPDIPGSTTITGIAGDVLTISNNASATNANENPRVNVGATAAVGAGAPIGVPVRIMGVNSSSGTEATWASYAESGVAAGGCASNMNTNAAVDPNTATNGSPNNGPHIALENNSDQIDQFAVTDFPGDSASQAIEAATTLYIESDGVDVTNPYAAKTTIAGTGYSGVKAPLNGLLPGTAAKLQNTYPTARTLFNIYLTSGIRASAGGFINWLCDSNSNFSKGLDNSTGLNFDAELTTAISTTFGFPRLNDQSPAPATSTPADGLAAPNNSCAASLAVSTTSGSNQVTLTAGGNFPVDILNAGGLVGGGSVSITGAGIPSGTTVSSGGGTSTLTMSNTASATATGVTAVFGGVPAVTSVASSQN